MALASAGATFMLLPGWCHIRQVHSRVGLHVRRRLTICGWDSSRIPFSLRQIVLARSMLAATEMSCTFSIGAFVRVPLLKEPIALVLSPRTPDFLRVV